MQNPFTTTFSKIPDYTYIPTEKTDEIIENFSYDNPSESVYKITGVRGSGKTVILAKAEEEFSLKENRENGWLVYRLTPSRDMLGQLASMLHKEKFIKNTPKSRSINLSANVLGTGGGVGYSSTKNEEYFDIGVELEQMLEKASKEKKKILIGIDEVSKTKDMIIFASEYGKWLRAGYPVYLICTGLYENIEQLYNVKNLTFFRRATTIKTEPLSITRMTEMYKAKLNLSIVDAKQFALITRGYAYAFQELGTLYFKKRESDSVDDIIDNLKSELFAYAYEKIWEEMSPADRSLASLLTEEKEYKRDEILPLMDKPGNYSVYRDRLFKKGIIQKRQAYISLALPFFNDYIKEYGMAEI